LPEGHHGGDGREKREVRLVLDSISVKGGKRRRGRKKRVCRPGHNGARGEKKRKKKEGASRDNELVATLGPCGRERGRKGMLRPFWSTSTWEKGRRGEPVRPPRTQVTKREKGGGKGGRRLATAPRRPPPAQGEKKKKKGKKKRAGILLDRVEGVVCTFQNPGSAKRKEKTEDLSVKNISTAGGQEWRGGGEKKRGKGRCFPTYPSTFPGIEDRKKEKRRKKRGEGKGKGRTHLPVSLPGFLELRPTQGEKKEKGESASSCLPP